MINIEYPTIHGTNDHEKLEEMRSYLFQLVDTLNYVLNTLENQNKGDKA